MEKGQGADLACLRDGELCPCCVHGPRMCMTESGPACMQAHVMNVLGEGVSMTGHGCILSVIPGDSACPIHRSLRVAVPC